MGCQQTNPRPRSEAVLLKEPAAARRYGGNPMRLDALDVLLALGFSAVGLLLGGLCVVGLACWLDGGPAKKNRREPDPHP
jgi:hypothetical protein